MQDSRLRLKDRGNATGHGRKDAFAQVVPQRLMSGLASAMRLARGGLDGDKLQRFREQVGEVLDRAEAWALTRGVGAAREDRAQDAPARSDAARARPARRATLAAGAEIGPEPVSEWLLIPFGRVEVERPLSGESFTFTPEHATAAARWFAQLGRKLAIDYEHQTFDQHNTRPDGLRPAAGWIGGLEVRDDGLWAVDVAWTDRAKSLLRSGEYRYFSPVIFWSDEGCTDLVALGPIALTNDPAMRGVAPLAASRAALLEQWDEWDDDEAREEGELRDDSESCGDQDAPPADGPASLRARLGWERPLATEDDAGDEAAAGAAEDRDSEIVPQRLLNDLQVEVATLRRQIAAERADGFVERGMRLGKILDATSMDWRDDYLRDAEEAEQRLHRAPVLRPPGRVLALNARGEPAVLPDGGGRFSRTRVTERQRRLGIEPADLEAFDRASADGRIRYSGT